MDAFEAIARIRINLLTIEHTLTKDLLGSKAKFDAFSEAYDVAQDLGDNAYELQRDILNRVSED